MYIHIFINNENMKYYSATYPGVMLHVVIGNSGFGSGADSLSPSFSRMRYLLIMSDQLVICSKVKSTFVIMTVILIYFFASSFQEDNAFVCIAT